MVIVNAFTNEAIGKQGKVIKLHHFPATGQGMKTI